jgi:hypothetical protein
MEAVKDGTLCRNLFRAGRQDQGAWPARTAM